MLPMLPKSTLQNVHTETLSEIYYIPQKQLNCLRRFQRFVVVAKRKEFF